MKKKMGIIGFGNMGQALYKGLIEFSSLSNKDFLLSSPKPKKHQNNFPKAVFTKNNTQLVEQSEIIILAVKPQILPSIIKEIKDVCQSQHLIVSCAAGMSLQLLQQHLPNNTPCIRIMPNMAVQVGSGVCSFASNDYVRKRMQKNFENYFSKLGYMLELPENQFDAVTGLSGSGPAFIFTMMDACIDAGVKVGLSRHVAKEMVKHTFLGSAQLSAQTGKHPGQLKDLITSPGGTAITGLHTLEKGGVRHTLIEAIEAASNRAKELSKL